MKLTNLFSLANVKKAFAFLAVSLMAMSANASIFGTILENETGKTIITTLFVIWGATKIIDAVGEVMSGSSNAVKTGMQGVVLMVIGWQWDELIGLFGFTK